jgi:hypothetical protein
VAPCHAIKFQQRNNERFGKINVNLEKKNEKNVCKKTLLILILNKIEFLYYSLQFVPLITGNVKQLFLKLG